MACDSEMLVPHLDGNEISGGTCRAVIVAQFSASRCMYFGLLLDRSK